ncbi:MAG: hypothetical protein VX447_09980 [Pseudomonadota bacterium]|uniref:hypothetical protein n=1 Tax=Gallaecimonas pentaromativorans TaxID=584787 RepID=UPI0011CECCA5|nr:hypothetical protein [Gallaecimonas pentaromativorans]MED5525067.1 hypothetical protein [Pseudomonadota bacterium]
MVIWVLKIIAFVLVVLFIFSALHAIHFINSGMLRVKDEYKTLVRVVPFLFLVKRIYKEDGLLFRRQGIRWLLISVAAILAVFCVFSFSYYFGFYHQT